MAKKAKPRVAATLEISPYILIVCEGGKTEPNYFNELIFHYKLPSVNVVIDGDCGSDPVSVVRHGLDLYNKQKRFNNRAYDKVFFVFDRDQYHLQTQGHNYQSAISSIKDKKQPKDVFIAINSIPCFEFWLLLHHTEKAKPYNDIVGSYSAGDAVKEDLKSYWPTYEKGSPGIFQMALAIDGDDMSTAIKRSNNVLVASQTCDDPNPSTQMHSLIQFLLGMRKPR
ncbi:MAG: RloB family protein [Polynucleobacter sp.]|uniref:RloB family protein n=1 Tax=Polynucleobacter sp. TaxID=2029855 RepID=UPI002728CC41|nr:RloB family protein [Polynucleobacter sp.]MDO8713712.1 RloB family protein [Polynucleobacter sp.]